MYQVIEGTRMGLRCSPEIADTTFYSKVERMLLIIEICVDSSVSYYTPDTVMMQSWP